MGKFLIGDSEVKTKATVETAGITVLEEDAKRFAEYLGVPYIQKYTDVLDEKGNQILGEDNTPKQRYNGIKRKKMSDAVGTFIHLVASEVEKAVPDENGVKTVVIKFTP